MAVQRSMRDATGPLPAATGPDVLYVFDGFTLDLRRGALFHAGSEVRIRPRTFDVLTFLVVNAGRLVSKQELIDTVWGGVAVTDDSLVQCLVEIRKAVGDAITIRTIRGRGYLLEAEVRRTASADQTSLDPLTTRQSTSIPASGESRGPLVALKRTPWRRATLTAVLALLLVTSLMAWWGWPRGSPLAAPAERAYAAGRAEYNRRSRTSLRQAIDHFESAIAIDPTYVLAYVGLADALTLLGVFGAVPPADVAPRARAAATTAIELDPTSAEAWTALGHSRVQHDWDWSAGESAYQRAFALNPTLARTHRLYGLLLITQGRCTEGLEQDARGRALDGRSGAGITHYLCRRNEEAVSHARAGESANSLAEFWLALAYLQLGRPDDALAAALASRDDMANAPTWVVGYIHGRSGRHAQALEVKRAIEAQARVTYVPATDLAFLAIGLDDKEEALRWLERGYEERSHWMDLLAVHPLLDPLRSEPRFLALLHKMKLPPDVGRNLN